MAARKKREINLLVEPFGPSTVSEQLLAWALTYGRYIIIITQIIVLSVFFARFKLDRDQTDLKDLALQKQALIESMVDFEKDVNSVQKKIGYIRQTTHKGDLFLKIINYLGEKIPTDIVFKSLNLTQDKINIEATAVNMKTFNATIKFFQNDNHFKDTTVENLVRKTNGSIDFRITINIDNNKFYSTTTL